MSHSLIQSPTAAVLKCPECGFEITSAVLQLVRQHEPNYKAVFEACLAQNKHIRQTIEGHISELVEIQRLRQHVADLSEELKQAQEKLAERREQTCSCGAAGLGNHGPHCPHYVEVY